MKNLNSVQQKLYDQFQNENDANLHQIVGGKQSWDNGHIIAKMVLEERKKVKDQRDRDSSREWHQKPVGILTIGVVTGIIILAVGYCIFDPIFKPTP